MVQLTDHRGFGGPSPWTSQLIKIYENYEERGDCPLDKRWTITTAIEINIELIDSKNYGGSSDKLLPT